MRVEHEIFYPKPVFRWSAGNGGTSDSDEDDRTASRPNKGETVQHNPKKQHDTAKRAWSARMSKIYVKKHRDIDLESPAHVNEKFDDIRRYFEVLSSVKKRDTEDVTTFVCYTRIRNGFIAPIHLLTGLLVHFESSWDTILKAFDRDASQKASIVGLGKNGRDFRQIQMFIYNCWLLWGPSIPICNCPFWNARYRVIQYGFGDENNSIEVVGESEAIDRYLENLISPLANRNLLPMAVPATVKGLLQLSGSFKGRYPGELDALPQAARDSWDGDQDERPVLYVTLTEGGNVMLDERGINIVNVGDIGPPRPTGRRLTSQYYSAYLWVAMVITVPNKAKQRESMSINDGEQQAWKDLVPFFEHGNLADPESCLFAKRQLVTKVLSAIANFIDSWEKADSVPIHFAYACSIDDSGCSGQLTYPKWAGSSTIKDLLKKALDDAADAHGPDSIYQRIKDQDIIAFDHYSENAGEHEYSACQLPLYVAAHYRSMADIS